MAEPKKEETPSVPEPAPAPDCLACNDTGKVMLSLSGASGVLTRDVPCPECGPGVKMSGELALDVDALRRTMKQVALIAMAALVLGFLAYLSGMGTPLPKIDLKKVSPPE